MGSLFLHVSVQCLLVFLLLGYRIREGKESWKAAIACTALGLFERAWIVFFFSGTWGFGGIFLLEILTTRTRLASCV